MKVLFRKDLDTFEEFQVCSKFFPTFEFRSQIPSDSLVLGRFSVLPYYRELEEELALKNSNLINTFSQHSWIADVTSWAGDLSRGIPSPLEERTPRTWSTWGNLPEGSFVLKGKTNSRKWRWNTHMFASSRDEVRVVASRLLDDAFISEQGLVVREYFPLRKLGEGLNGLPISNEWRVFFWGNTLLCKGFYWASHEEFFHSSEWTREAERFSLCVAEEVSKYCNFFVLDVAQREDGSWVLIEVNDGQMSGLSTIPPEELYSSLLLRGSQNV